MIGKGQVSIKPITIFEAKEILKKGIEDMEEPLYEQNIALDYLNKFARLSAEEGQKMVEELMALNDKLKEELAVKIADIQPKDEEDVRSIVAKERFVLEKSEIQKILELVSKYRKE